MMQAKVPIGVFDSGYGGLTILKEIVSRLPQYDYIYLGDNARAPYGNRSFDTVYQYTWQCVQWFFSKGCPLVILACNTASAKALRTIQQQDLPLLKEEKKVLGVIRPTTEIVGKETRSNHVGVLATKGTVASGSYVIEIEKFFPEVSVTQEACPIWVPLVENNVYDNAGADYFIQQHVQALMAKDAQIDTVILGCTHYPLLQNKIRQYLPDDVRLISQGTIVAASLEDYLQRHTEISNQLSQHGARAFYTTDAPADFDEQAKIFFGQPVQSQHLDVATIS
jgi:glutamate racemase